MNKNKQKDPGRILKKNKIFAARIAVALTAVCAAGMLTFGPAADTAGTAVEAQAFERDAATYDLPDVVQGFASTYGVLVQTNTGKILAARNSDQRMNPASMTKVMTVLVACDALTSQAQQAGTAAVQNGQTALSALLSQRVTITQDEINYAINNGCTRAGFVAGEQPTIQDLLFGTILPSGADAALALGRAIAGSDADFVALMNQKAAELGLSNTHFTNCIGLYNDAHYTTCEDMATIMTAAVDNQLALAILSAPSTTLGATPQHLHGIQLRNQFLNRIQAATLPGICFSAKTGYIRKAGYCAASFFISWTGVPYVCVTGHSTSSQQAVVDHMTMYNVFAK